MTYGATARDAIGTPAAMTQQHARAAAGAALVLIFAVLGIYIAASDNPTIQIDTSVKVQGPPIVRLATTQKDAVKAKELGSLLQSLEKSSYCWFRDLGLSSQCRFPSHSVQPSLASADKVGTPEISKHQCLASLLVEKKKASGPADVGGGDVSGCDTDTCDKCKQAPLLAPQAEEVALKRYMDSSAAVDVYMAKNPDVAPYLKDAPMGCPIGPSPTGPDGPSELSCLELLLEQRALETRTMTEGVDMTQHDATDIIAQCDNVEEYVNILAHRDAENALKIFITDLGKLELYEAENPSISDYTDGTCPHQLDLDGTTCSTFDCSGQPINNINKGLTVACAAAGCAAAECCQAPVANVCTCGGGTAATGSACTHDGASICTACDEGFVLHTDNVNTDNVNACVYTVHVLAGNYVGCFADNTPNGKRDLPIGTAALTTSDRPTTLDDCGSQCAGYKYMGLQAKSECYCGNSYGSQGAAECPDDCGLLGDRNVSCHRLAKSWANY